MQLYSVHLVSFQRICIAYELLDSTLPKPHHVSIILKPFVSVLSYIHSLCIIRRDVRAESILISSKVGYLSWLAPKLLSVRGYTIACGIWAVAATVIEHTDDKPFLHCPRESIVRQRTIRHSTPPPVFDIPNVYF